MTKIQFYAIELARNREGHNDQIRHNFKPKKRKAKGENIQEEPFHSNLTQEVQNELQNILGGNHPLMKWIKKVYLLIDGPRKPWSRFLCEYNVALFL